jgi:hypothetical protein
MKKLIDNQLYGIALVLLFSATFAAFIGFVSPDSWNYVHLTQSIVSGNGCEINGKYFAVFPCGYPITLALTSLSNDPATIIIVSKFTNALLIFGSFICLRKLISHQWAATLIILAPSTLLISHYTWSENLFLFATSLTLLQIHRLANTEKDIRLQYGLLVLALLIGISSRYFFAPFAFLLWVICFLIYGKKVAIRVLPAFAVASFAFIAYYFFNMDSTGFGTGMQRIPAPESLLFLIIHFFWTLLRYELPFTLIVLVTLMLLSRSFPSLTNVKNGLNSFSQPRLMLIAAGFSYLFLAFTLRINTQYDLYGFRTIGYGCTFILAALFAAWTKQNPHKKDVFLSTLIAGVISLSVAQRVELKNIANAWESGNTDYHSISKKLAAYTNQSQLKDAEVIVSFGIPMVSENIASNSYYFYGDSVTVLSPSTKPYGIQESLESFLNKIKMNSHKKCLIDFTPFSTVEIAKEVLYSKFDVDLSFSNLSIKPERIRTNRYDPKLADFFISKYTDKGYITCAELFTN